MDVDKIKRILCKIVPTALFLLSPLFLFAQAPCDPAGGKLCNPIKAVELSGLLEKVWPNVVKLGIPVVALAIIYSGFLFVSARGNPEKLTKAKDALLYSLIGAALLLGSYAIAQVLSDTVKAL